MLKLFLGRAVKSFVFADGGQMSFVERMQELYIQSGDDGTGIWILNMRREGGELIEVSRHNTASVETIVWM